MFIKKLLSIAAALSVVVFVSSFQKPPNLAGALVFNGHSALIPDFDMYDSSELFYVFDAVNSNSCERISDAKNHFKNDRMMFPWLEVKEYSCLYQRENSSFFNFKERKETEFYNIPFDCEEVYGDCDVDFKEYA